MKILGIGVDIVNNKRFKNLIKNKNFLKRTFSVNEIKFSIKKKDKVNFFAKRFAAKEAIYKALSASGVEGLGWRDADIANNRRGAPVVTLTGACKTALERLTPDGYNPEISISLSDEPPHALAFVVLSVIGPKDQ